MSIDVDEATSSGSKHFGGLVINCPPRAPSGAGEMARPKAVEEGDDLDFDPYKSAQSPDGEDATERRPPGVVHVVQSSSLRNAPGDGSRKRKSVDAEKHGCTRHPTSKRLKLDRRSVAGALPSALPSDRSLLPAEVWHHIFTFVPPRTLGKLLQVNKLFNVYLDPSSSLLDDRPVHCAKTSAPNLQPDFIWQASRRRFWPHMPTPLQDKTELDMWRLVCATTCQFCGRVQSCNSSEAEDGSHPSPGPDGVVIIWAFAIRTCGNCLLSHSTKEIELLLSTTVPSVLLSALPFVLMTNALHVLSPSALRNSQIPEGVQLTKVFLSCHLEILSSELASVRSLGAATTEEWLKGLEDRGKKCRSDALRWDKWAGAGGVKRMQTTDGIPSIIAGAVGGSPLVITQRSSVTPLESPESLTQHAAGDVPPTGLTMQHMASRSSMNEEPFSRINSAAEPLQHQSRVRTLEEVQELKAVRRAEIERRAMLLEPPLSSTVLVYIPSFQAALQIVSPLDEPAWELLKPRLLAQRTEAEIRLQREQEVAAHSRLLLERSEERRTVESSSQATKKLADKDWDDAQAPLRAQISSFADEIIREGWKDGDKVTAKNCPLFAAEVLQYVRKRFYAEIGKNAAAARAAGREAARDPPEGPFTYKLTLENMKWLFDTKVKPYTASYGKQLFFCNGDGCETNHKLYGFEGVVQHYAAKHTTALSQGIVIVYWRSEWPEEPPFHPDPLSKVMISGPGTTTISFKRGIDQSFYEYAAKQRQPIYTHTTPASYQETHGASHYGSPSFLVGVYGSQDMYASSAAGLSARYDAQGIIAQATVRPGLSMTSGDKTYNAYQTSIQYGYGSDYSASGSDRVLAQLDDLARNLREVWQITNGLMKLPGDMRAHVILYHVVKRYRIRFSETPPLTMLIDGLNRNKEMRPVRNINGLRCKACNLPRTNGMLVRREKETYSLPQLLNHFQHKHIEPFQEARAPLLDWTVDMVHISDLFLLSNLRKMVDLDNHRYAVIAEAISDLYSSEMHKYSTGVVPGWQGSECYPTNTTSSNVNDLDKVYNMPSNSAASVALQPTVLNSGSKQISISSQDLRQAERQETHQAIVPVTSGQSAKNITPSGASHSKLQYLSRTPRQDHSDRGLNSRQASLLSGYDNGGSSKDCRTAPRHADRSRRSITRLPQVTSEQAGAAEDALKLAEEGQQRQEEAIRAMWVANQREAARMHSDFQAAYYERTKSSTGSTLSHPFWSPPETNQDTTPPRARSPPAVVQKPGTDLLAGLESLLSQQQASTFDSPPSSRLTGPSTREQRPTNGLWSPSDSRRDLGFDADSVGQLVRRNSQHPHGSLQASDGSPRCVYRNNFPRTYEQGSNGVRATSVAQRTLSKVDPSHSSRSVHGMRYQRTNRQAYCEEENAREYECDAQRVRSLARYNEAYALIKVKDSQGECYVNQTIGQDRQPLYAEYTKHPQAYREVVSADHEHELLYRSQPYARIREDLSQQLVYETVGRHSHATRRLAHASDAVPYEKYDPRYPAGPTSTFASLPIRYY